MSPELKDLIEEFETAVELLAIKENSTHVVTDHVLELQEKRRMARKELETAIDHITQQSTSEINTLRKIKHYCCTTKEPGHKALAHIIRLCIDGGVKEQYTELEKMRFK